MDAMEYTVILEANEDEPGFTATVPALPGCVSVGETHEEALENIRDAISLWIKMARESGEPIPEDGAVVTRVSVGA